MSLQNPRNRKRWGGGPKRGGYNRAGGNTLRMGNHIAFVAHGGGNPVDTLQAYLKGRERTIEHTGPVKTLADMTPEERAALEARYGAKING